MPLLPRLRLLLALSLLLALGVTTLAMTTAQPVSAQERVEGPGVTGTVVRYAAMPSRHVAARTVDVWLPPGYEADRTRRYPVLYMHDGQNVFDPATAYGGVDWRVDEVLTDLIALGAMEPVIVVGVWNTPARWAEYFPQRVFPQIPDTLRAVFQQRGGEAPLQADGYLRFLVQELKPFIDQTYRTRPDRDHTAVMGSSMGGLISLYALCEYPDVFGRAGAVSTHWPATGDAMRDYLAAHLPAPGTHRVYFDHGTATLDALYAPFQGRVDAMLAGRGFQMPQDYVSLVFPGTDHSERAWQARVHLPLLYLFARHPVGATR